MKSPDEIKKGLECCIIPLCDECPYDNDPSCVVKNADALALIQQLQAENSEKDARIRQLEAEREALVADIRLAFSSYVGACETCTNGKTQAECDVAVGCAYCKDKKCICNSCDSGYSNWQWRGVQKEE